LDGQQENRGAEEAAPLLLGAVLKLADEDCGDSPLGQAGEDAHIGQDEAELTVTLGFEDKEEEKDIVPKAEDFRPDLSEKGETAGSNDLVEEPGRRNRPGFSHSCPWR